MEIKIKPKVERRTNQVIITCPDEEAAENCAVGLRKGFESPLIRKMLIKASRKK